MARPENSGQNKKFNVSRLLIVVGITIVACIVVRSALSAGLFISTSLRDGPHWTGSFWPDAFPIILLTAITAIGVFGIYQLLQAVRK